MMPHPQASPGPEVAEVEAALADVLARPEFAPAPQSLMQQWLGSGFGWLREHVWQRLTGLLPDPDWANPAWTTLSIAALAVGALLGLALLVYMIVLAVRALRSRRRRRAPTIPGAVLRPPTAAEWEARSLDAAGRGDWRGAALDLYQAVLLHLGEAEVVRLDPSKTPGDYRREVRRSGAEFVAPMESFLAWFERLVYGRAGDGAAQFDRLRQVAAELPRG